MSLTTMDEIKCACGEVFEAEVLQSVSVSQSPELKERILAGDFNIVQCPACKQYLYAERFVLYHDRDQELLAFVYPKDFENRKEEIAEQMGHSYEELQNDLSPEERLTYKPFLIFGMDRLCDLVKLEEEIGIEVEIAGSICSALGLSTRHVHLDVARRNNIMPLLPVDRLKNADGTDANIRDRVIAGIKKVLQENGALVHYESLLKRLEDVTVFPVKESEFVSVS